MSTPDYYTHLTAYGSGALSAAITGGDSISLTHLAIGDANGAGYDPDGSETTLVNEVHRLPIRSIAADPDNPAWLIVEAIVPPDVGGWWIREAGIFDDDNKLFSITKYPPTYKAVLNDGTASTLTIQIVLQVTNTDSINLVINPVDGFATRSWVLSTFPWADEPEAKDDNVEHKIIDPKRLHAVIAEKIAEIDSASADDLAALSQSLTNLSNSINQALSGKANTDHDHGDAYAAKDHNHLEEYSPANHDHDGVYSPEDHNHAVSEIAGLTDWLAAQGVMKDVFVTDLMEIPVSANVSQAHNLGVRPRIMLPYFVCVSSEHGWAAGDICNLNTTVAGRAERHVNAWGNETNLGLYVGERCYISKRAGSGYDYINIAEDPNWRFFAIGIK